jgi:serine/threonine protein kinase
MVNVYSFLFLGVATSVIVTLAVVVAQQLLKLKRLYKQNGGEILEGIKNIRIYTKIQLKKITNNYKNVIGKGQLGQVYKGTDLKEKQQVSQQLAVKKSMKIDKDMKKEFTDEVILQSRMRHKNIVRLLGCCLEMEVPMLVYEFATNGSLYDFLFTKRGNIPVDTRLRIAIGSAEGLTYMHSSAESTILHGDVKSANILLDENFIPKILYFGTSKLLAKRKDEKAILVTGDMGYIDPVYMEQGLLTQKSDVYSFGIVLIELITRRAATYDEKRSYVANFVQAYLDKRVRNFIDNDITSEEDVKLLEMVSGVAVDCLKDDPKERPDMKQVEHQLHIIGQSVQLGQQTNYRGGLSPTPDDVALFKPVE